MIKFLETPVNRPTYDGYICDVISSSAKYDVSKLENYLPYLEVLDPRSQAVRRVMEAILH